jgi:hypothetical protein
MEEKDMPQNPTFDVCAGATASAGSTTLTFTNNRTVQCTITGLGNRVDCGNSFTVPAQSNGVAGTKTCNIKANATTGNYSYSASVCPQGGNPVIIYQ